MPLKCWHHGHNNRKWLNSLKIFFTKQLLTKSTISRCFHVYSVQPPQIFQVQVKISTVQPMFPDYLTVCYDYGWISYVWWLLLNVALIQEGLVIFIRTHFEHKLWQENKISVFFVNDRKVFTVPWKVSAIKENCIHLWRALTKFGSFEWKIGIL